MVTVFTVPSLRVYGPTVTGTSDSIISDGLTGAPELEGFGASCSAALGTYPSSPVSKLTRVAYLPANE